MARNKPVTIPEVLTELCTGCAKLQIITGVSGRFQRVGCKKRAKAEAATKRDALACITDVSYPSRTAADKPRSRRATWRERGARRARTLLAGVLALGVTSERRHYTIVAVVMCSRITELISLLSRHQSSASTSLT